MTNITGTTGNDSLVGLNGQDTILGLDSNDILIGLAGNDFLDGGRGNDTLQGSLGSDIYIVDSTSDVVIEKPYGEIDTVRSSVNYTLGAYLENLTLTGSAINGTGNELNNRIEGNNSNNVLYGLNGNDTLIGGNGNDTLFGQQGNDSINGGAGNDLLDSGEGINVLSGGTGNDTYVTNGFSTTVNEAANAGNDTVISYETDTLAANVENLTLFEGSIAVNGMGNELNNIITGNSFGNSLSGLNGNDFLFGGANNDTISGGVGNDTLDGGAGSGNVNNGDLSDLLFGGAGNDTFIVDNRADFVTENVNEGIDTIRSSVSFGLNNNVENLTLVEGVTNAILGAGNSLNNVITGNSLGNQLLGDVGNDTINGGAGNDFLNGGAGNDTISGNAGFDTLTGGGGVDSFRFNSPNEGVDFITDFSIVDDTITVFASSFGGGLTGGNTLNANQFFQGGTATIVGESGSSASIVVDSSVRFIYDPISSGLFFDSNGGDAEGRSQIAIISSGDVSPIFLSAADLFVI